MALSPKRFKALSLLLAFLILVFFSFLLFLPRRPVVVSGVVEAPGSELAPVAGAVVKVHRFDSGETLGVSAITDEAGRYEIKLRALPLSSLFLVATLEVSPGKVLRLSSLLPSISKGVRDVRVDLNPVTTIASLHLSEEMGEAAYVSGEEWAAALETAARLSEVMGVERADLIVGGPINPEELGKGLRAEALREAMELALSGDEEGFQESIVVLEVESGVIHPLPHQPIPLMVWGRTIGGKRVKLEGFALDLTGLNASMEGDVINIETLEGGFITVSYRGLSKEIEVGGVPEIVISLDELSRILEAMEKTNEELSSSLSLLNASEREWRKIEERARAFIEHIDPLEEYRGRYLDDVMRKPILISWSWWFDLEGRIEWEDGFINPPGYRADYSSRTPEANTYRRGPLLIKELNVWWEVIQRGGAPYLYIYVEFEAEPCDGGEQYDLPIFSLVVNERGGGARAYTTIDMPRGWGFNEALSLPLLEGEEASDFLLCITLSVWRYSNEEEAREAVARQFAEYIERHRRALEAKLEAIEELRRIEAESTTLQLTPLLDELSSKLGELEKKGVYRFLEDNLEELQGLSEEMERLQKGLNLIRHITALGEFYSRVEHLTGEERVEAIKRALELGKTIVPLPEGVGSVLDFYVAALDAIADAIGNIERSLSEKLLTLDPETFEIALEIYKGLDREKLMKAYKVSQLLKAIKDP